MNDNRLLKLLILFVMVIVVNVNSVAGADINKALDVVKKYQELARKGDWPEQSKLIIKEDLEGFKDKLLSIPTLKALEEMTSNELYAHIFGKMMIDVKIDELEIIDSIQESEELVHVITRSTIIRQNVKNSTSKMLTLKYIDNEWKISGAERLNRTADALHLQLLKAGTQKLRAQMLELGKLVSQMSKMQEAGTLKHETQTTKMQESQIQKSVTQKNQIENPETQK